MKKFAPPTYIIFGILICFACNKHRSDIPDDVIARPEMTIILKEILIAEAAVSVNEKGNSNSDKSAAYYKYIFQKHNVDKSKFDASLKYYAEHADMMKEMYDTIIVQLNKEELKK